MFHRETAFRAIAVLIGVALPIAVFEGVGALLIEWDDARFWAYMPDDVRAVVNREDHHIPTEPDPYLGFRMQPGIQRERVQTNAWGLREGPIEATPAPGVLRIVFLGGSVAWGYESNSNDDTIPAYLEDVLAMRAGEVEALRGRRIEVLNAGVPAYVSWQEALLYALRLRALQPAWIFSLDATNDIASAIINAVAGAPMRYRAMQSAYLAAEPNPIQALGRWILEGARELNAARAVERLHPKSVAELGAPPPREVAEQLAQAAAFLTGAARADGARVVTVLQPMVILAGTKPLTGYEGKVVTEFEHRMPGRNAYYAESYAAMRERLERLARERSGDYRWIDATDAFVDTPDPVYTDDCHLTPLGRRRLAERIADRWIAGLRSPHPEP